MSSTRLRSISLFLLVISGFISALSMAQDAHAWTGYPGYPGYPYAPATAWGPPVMPVRPYPVAYHRYPGYARPAIATARPNPPGRSVATAVPVSYSKATTQVGLPAALADNGLSSDQRKRLFIELLLPLVSRENERLLDVRQELAGLQSERASGRALSESQLGWLREMADKYRIDADAGTSAILERLLVRVDAIPIGLAIAQAANESAWGRSRFAQEGNNLFGIRTYDTDQGIEPQARAPGKTHLVRSYDSIEASVRGYMHMLNSHPAYRSLRAIRSAQRERKQPLSALQLADGLGAYSEQGDDYIALIKTMIRSNQLEQFA
jgi:Bax protein